MRLHCNRHIAFHFMLINPNSCFKAVLRILWSFVTPFRHLSHSRTPPQILYTISFPIILKTAINTPHTTGTLSYSWMIHSHGETVFTLRVIFTFRIIQCAITQFTCTTFKQSYDKPLYKIPT